ncbi:MAG: hypothetical protein J2P41_15680 [Blastocatellia bacterium]|nr:hypothetical protein [Blastocatellia bacterium]
MRNKWEAVRFSVFALIITGIVGINVIAQEKKQEESPANTGTTNSVIVGKPVLMPMLTASSQIILPASTVPIGPFGFIQNAPFSGEVVTESIQTLNDGNRIIQRSSNMVYRDSQGRTRIEQTLKLPFRPIGQPGGENVEHKFINITDPATGVHYSFNTQTRTVQKFTTAPQPAANPKAPTLNRVVSMGQPVMGNIYSSVSASGYFPQRNSCKTDSLGKQMIEGVEAEGTQTTCTIPEGTMGNEKPIEYSQERWFSQELHMYVMTKSSDPRSGESTQRVTNINRDEPDASLFQPPADYTISEPQMHKELIERVNMLNSESKSNQ